MTSCRIRSFALALVAAGALTAAAPVAQQRDCDALCAAGAALVQRFELREDSVPARERSDWAPPRKIAVADVAVADALRPLARGAEVVGVAGLRNFAGMADVIADADVLVGLCTPELIAKGRKLRWVQLLNAGADSCATIPAVAERRILVTNLQRIQGPHMAEHAIALMLGLARALPVYAAEQHAGAFTRGFRELRAERPFEIEGKTLLVVGLGGIGTEVARRAHGLGMRVIATRNSSRSGPEYVAYVGLADEYVKLAEQADVIVNATPLTPATRGMFDARFFAAVKPGALFVNIGRGESVVTDALVAALRSGRVGGAGLDVTDPEPLPARHPLWAMENVIITPHIATSSDFRNDRTLTLVAENVRRYIRGDKLLSVVDLKQGY